MGGASDPVAYVASASARAVVGALVAESPERLRSLLDSNPAQARLIARAAAEVGLQGAQILLGRMLLEGTGGPRDPGAAFKWFQRAAAAGSVEACNMLGRCYENGWGVDIDYTRAAHYFRCAAEAGDSWAQYNLGHLYLNGLGVVRSASQAVGWYQAASEQRHARATNLLGRCYEQGWGIARSLSEAVRCYRKSAEAGYFRGQYNLATALLGAGCATEAHYWYQRAVEQAPARSRPWLVSGWRTALNNNAPLRWLNSTKERPIDDLATIAEA